MSEEGIKDRPPKANDTCAVTAHKNIKTAALLFDKVWFAQMRYEEISAMRKQRSETPLPPPPPSSVIFFVQEVEKESEARIDQKHRSYLDRELPWKKGKAAPNIRTGEMVDIIIRETAEIYTMRGIRCIPFYWSEDAFSQEFQTGEKEAYKAVLEHVPVVDEKGVLWEQALEFRKDQESRDNYRALRLWINDVLKGKSLAECTDIIVHKLGRYEKAIAKHGFKTRNGLPDIVIGSGMLTSLAGGAGVAALTGGEIWGAIAAGAITLGKAATYIKKRKLDLLDIEQGQHSEIALIHEIKKEFGKLEENKRA